MVPGEGYWLKVTENGTWTVGDTTDSGQGREITKMGREKWGTVAVYPNLTATVLAEVTLNGKAVSMGSIVAAFAGEELRAKREVVLAGGKSYVTLNVNLEGTEDVSFRIWEEEQRKEYKVTETMGLEMGETYGSAEGLVKLDVVAPRVGVPIVSFMRKPFGFSFNTEEGAIYKVEASDDLRKWEQLRDVKGTGELFKFLDFRKAIYEQQYYRVRLVE